MNTEGERAQEPSREDDAERREPDHRDKEVSTYEARGTRAREEAGDAEARGDHRTADVLRRSADIEDAWRLQAERREETEDAWLAEGWKEGRDWVMARDLERECAELGAEVLNSDGSWRTSQDPTEAVVLRQKGLKYVVLVQLSTDLAVLSELGEELRQESEDERNARTEPDSWMAERKRFGLSGYRAEMLRRWMRSQEAAR